LYLKINNIFQSDNIFYISFFSIFVVFSPKILSNRNTKQSNVGNLYLEHTNYVSPLTLWVRTPPMWCVLDTTLCDNVFQWLATGRWFSPGTPVPSTNKSDCHDRAEILSTAEISTINQTIKSTLTIISKFPLKFLCRNYNVSFLYYSAHVWNKWYYNL
jgi:hypothetical protein